MSSKKEKSQNMKYCLINYVSFFFAVVIMYSCDNLETQKLDTECSCNSPTLVYNCNIVIIIKFENYYLILTHTNTAIFSVSHKIEPLTLPFRKYQ